MKDCFSPSLVKAFYAKVQCDAKVIAIFRGMMDGERDCDFSSVAAILEDCDGRLDELWVAFKEEVAAPQDELGQ